MIRQQQQHQQARRQDKKQTARKPRDNHEGGADHGENETPGPTLNRPPLLSARARYQHATSIVSIPEEARGDIDRQQEDNNARPHRRMISRFAQFAARRALVRPSVSRPAVSFFSTEETPVPGFGKGKTSTGIVGLPVDPDAVSKIVVKYQELLDKMAASDMPETAQYRMDLEKIARFRIKIAMENPDDPDLVEDLVQCGQVEELVKQADDEMEVLDMYLSTRMWELVASEDDADDFEVEHDPDPADDQKGMDNDDAAAAPEK